MCVKIIKSNTLLEQKKKFISLLKYSYHINFPDQKFDDGYFLNKFDEIYNYINNQEGIIIAFIKNKQVKGFIWIFEYNFLNEKRIHINEFVIEKSFQNKGIGTKLINRVYEYANNNSIKVIDLNVSINNKNAINFYKNKSFKEERLKMSRKL